MICRLYVSQAVTNESRRGACGPVGVGGLVLDLLTMPGGSRGRGGAL